MRKRRARRMTALVSPALGLLVARMAMASAEVVARRGMMMLRGTCSDAEYRRMVQEKMAAGRTSMRRAAAGRSGPVALLTPFAGRAARNVRRLRKGK